MAYRRTTMHYYAVRRFENVSVSEFLASLLLGLLSVAMPILLFICAVAVCVYVARWWFDRPRKHEDDNPKS